MAGFEIIDDEPNEVQDVAELDDYDEDADELRLADDVEQEAADKAEAEPVEVPKPSRDLPGDKLQNTDPVLLVPDEKIKTERAKNKPYTTRIPPCNIIRDRARLAKWGRKE